MMEDSDRCNFAWIMTVLTTSVTPLIVLRRRNGTYRNNTSCQPRLYRRVAHGREIETRPISRIPVGLLHVTPMNDNVTFRFAMGSLGAASIYILKQPSTYRTRSQLNPRSPLVNSSTRVISSILKCWQPSTRRN